MHVRSWRRCWTRMRCATPCCWFLPTSRTRPKLIISDEVDCWHVYDEWCETFTLGCLSVSTANFNLLFFSMPYRLGCLRTCPMPWLPQRSQKNWACTTYVIDTWKKPRPFCKVFMVLIFQGWKPVPNCVLVVKSRIHNFDVQYWCCLNFGENCWWFVLDGFWIVSNLTHVHFYIYSHAVCIPCSYPLQRKFWEMLPDNYCLAAWGGRWDVQWQPAPEDLLVWLVESSQNNFFKTFLSLVTYDSFFIQTMAKFTTFLGQYLVG